MIDGNGPSNATKCKYLCIVYEYVVSKYSACADEIIRYVIAWPNDIIMRTPPSITINLRNIFISFDETLCITLDSGADAMKLSRLPWAHRRGGIVNALLPWRSSYLYFPLVALAWYTPLYEASSPTNFHRAHSNSRDISWIIAAQASHHYW